MGLNTACIGMSPRQDCRTCTRLRNNCFWRRLEQHFRTMMLIGEKLILIVFTGRMFLSLFFPLGVSIFFPLQARIDFPQRQCWALNSFPQNSVSLTFPGLRAARPNLTFRRSQCFGYGEPPPTQCEPTISSKFISCPEMFPPSSRALLRFTP